MGGRYPHIIRAVLARPWAIDPDSLAWAAMLDVLALRAAGEVLDETEIQARIDAAANGPRRGRALQGSIAILPLYGLISPRANVLSAMSGGTSAEQLGADFSAVVQDPDISGIVLDVDSPGGNVQGINELATLIREARGQKPIVAIANHDAASAAYWIASQADELVVTPSGGVGSIGIIGAHDDLTEALAMAGIKRTVITAGKFKGEGSFGQSLTDAAKAAIQADVDTYFGMFVGDVAKGRGVPAGDVRSGFGEGRMVMAKSAVASGMADRVDTFDNTIRRLASGKVAMRPGARAAAAGVTFAETWKPVTQDEIDDRFGETSAAELAALTADDKAAAPATPPSTTPDRVPGRRAQRERLQAELEHGYATVE